LPSHRRYASHHPFLSAVKNFSTAFSMLLKLMADRISFGKLVPDTNLNQLFIRESYKTIASSILEGNGSHKAIITGTPGIGKSLFLFYLLWKLVKDGKRVLFIYGTFNIYYDGKGGVFCFASGNLPLDNDVSFWHHSLWCLFDANRKGEANLKESSK
jgi:hypothetical protein